MIWDFFKGLGKSRVASVTNAARAKQYGVVAVAKGKAASTFNKAIDAPLDKAKGAAKGAVNKAKSGGQQQQQQQSQQQPQRKSSQDDGGEKMGFFSRKKQEPAPPQRPDLDQEYGGGDMHTVALDLSKIAAGTFQACVGWVVVLNGELRGKDYRLVDGKNVLGTAADCDVVLTDAYLSSKHATIRHENGTFTLIDLDSTNGTFLNDRRCSKEELIDNDKIRVGRTEIKFKSLY